MSQGYGERLTEIMNRPENKDKDVNYLCEITGRGRQYIYKLRNSDIENPDLKTLKQICDVYGVTLDWLLFGEEPPKMYYTEPGIYNILPKDLQDFVVQEENTPYIVFAKQLKNYDMENISESDMEFLVSALQMHYQKHKNKK